MNEPTHEVMIALGFTCVSSVIMPSYIIDISNFKEEYKVISVYIQKGNQYIYVRAGEKDKSREQDDLITIFNSDVNGVLTLEKIHRVYNALTDKTLKSC